MVPRPHRSGLLVESTDNQSRYSSAQERSGAHHAGLESHEDLHVVEPPPTEPTCRIPQGHHLGVSGRIVVSLTAIPPLSHDLVAPHDDATHGDVATLTGASGEVEGPAHKEFVARRHGLTLGPRKGGEPRGRLSGGSVRERPNRAVSKTAVSTGTVGSNPTASASHEGGPRGRPRVLFP